MNGSAASQRSHTRAAVPWPHRTLLATLSEPCRDELLGLGEYRRYEHGAAVLREKECTTHAFLLLAGFAKVTGSLDNGRVALLGIRVGGDIVGEMAALDGGPRSAAVTACGDLILRALPREVFLNFLRRQPEAALAITKVISGRLRWANQRRVDFNGYPTGIRLARVLVELAGAYGRPSAVGVIIDVGLTQHELGALAGADADTAGKELRRLDGNEVIKTGYRRVVIRDMAALKTYGHVSG